MKKYIIALALATASLSSCSKFLDIQPVGKVIPGSLSEYRAMLTKAYANGFLDKGMTEFRTDVALVRQDEYDLNSFNDIQVWNDNAASSGTQSWGWAEYYSSIFYANAIIANAGSISGGTTEEVNQLVGEAYLMRAFLHFNLVNLYGQPYTKAGAPQSLSVPIKKDLDLEGLPQRASVEAVYQAIIEDIEAARGLINVATWEDAYKYRFGKLSVDALAARVYLYQGNWAKSLEASEAVLAQKSDLLDLTAGATETPNHYTSVEAINAFELILNSSTGRAVRATTAFYNSYSADDLRKTLYYEQSTDRQGNPLDYYTVKKVDGTTAYRGSFRTSEFYLTSAEAAAASGQLAEARKRLLELQAKRYKASAYTAKATAVAAMTAEQLLAEIRLERKLELAFEGHYWFDLRRTTRPAITKTIDGKSYTLSADDARYTLPIPKEAIAANPSLAQ